MSAPIQTAHASLKQLLYTAHCLQTFVPKPLTGGSPLDPTWRTSVPHTVWKWKFLVPPLHFTAHICSGELRRFHSVEVRNIRVWNCQCIGNTHKWITIFWLRWRREIVSSIRHRRHIADDNSAGSISFLEFHTISIRLSQQSSPRIVWT